MPTPVAPVLHGGIFGAYTTGSGTFVGNQVTQTYADGVLTPPSAKPAILGFFKFEFEPYGVIVPSDITATYAGLPCQVFVADIAAGWGGSNDQRTIIGVMCLPGPTDVYTGSDFVLTFNLAGVAFNRWYVSFGCVAQGVDPSTSFTPKAFANTGATLAPSPYSMTLPAQTGADGDMLISVFSAEVTTGSQVLHCASSPRFNVENYPTGSPIPFAIGWRQLIGAPETDAITWDFNPAISTIATQLGWGVTFTLKALIVPDTVPNILGLTATAADAAILAAGLVTGVVTSAYDPIVPAGHVVSSSPVAGTSVLPGSAVDYVLSLGPEPTVPNLLGLTLAAALAALAAPGYVAGAITSLYSPTVPVGQVMLQTIPAGTPELPGTAVGFSLSLGPAIYFVPYVIGDTNTAAATAIAAAGLTVGAVTSVHSLYVPVGTVINQNPVAGTAVVLGYPVDLVESAGPPPPPPRIAPFDVDLTVISQYQNSPTLLALVENMAQYVDPRTNLETFFSYVWDVDTAVAFGLDIWGRIVGVSRLLQISGTNNVFGFYNTDVPFDWQPWNQAPFDGGPLATSSYLLPDDAFRTLILTKALANIVATTAPALNQLLKNLFPGRGICYVLDNGGMAMTFVFEFPLTNIEFAILTQSGALPHPAGVSFNVIVVPAGGTFGFKQQAPTALPFNQGTFYKR